jgi:demethylmenaquinone methyltransferase/2-methoxy-6-polyprenyl-1,4-benzoquinol methylase
MEKPVTPYGIQGVGKKQQVAQMFDSISGRYDFLNHFLSLGIDRNWRKKAIRQLEFLAPKTILDVATGTADFGLQAIRQLEEATITGIDISNGMLEKGREKIAKRKLGKRISLHQADSENIPFDAETFDAVTVAYGVRNFEDLQKGLKEMLRVTRIGGRIVILEFSKPTRFPMKQLFGLYFKFILPTIGRVVSKDSRAYTYLPESVAVFPEGEEFLRVMEAVGYEKAKQIRLSGGISTIYVGEKGGK